MAVDNKAKFTDALEDYLETVYELVRDKRFARVKDIAKARGVRSASVSPAMARLAEMGMVTYVRREYIELTPAGEKEARRIFARHQILTRLFGEILQLSPTDARENACAMEHSLSPEAMDRLVSFFEFIGTRREGRKFLTEFHRSFIGDNKSKQDPAQAAVAKRKRYTKLKSISELEPGESGHVAQINGGGAIRQRLLDMGILPEVLIEVERVAPTGDPIWIKLQGFQLSLRRKEAETVMIGAS